MNIKSLLMLFLALVIHSFCHSQIIIRFTVDMTGQTIGSGGLHIAGQFALLNSTTITANWQPGAAGSQLALQSGSIYFIDVSFPFSSAGKQLQFEFVRNDIWFNGTEDFSEGNPGDPNAFLDPSCGIDDGSGGYNRVITIPDCGGVYAAVWNRCARLTITQPPTLSLPADTTICIGSSIQLSATSNGSIVWSPSAGLSCTSCNNPVASPRVSTGYTVSTTFAGCTISGFVLITVDTTSLHAGSDQTIQQGDSIQLSATGGSNLVWQSSSSLSCTNCPSPFAFPVSTTSYIVTGTASSGCTTKDTVTVFVIGPCENIYLPTAFTPNGDGLNETFGPLNNLAIKIFRVFNRWGQMVFESKNSNNKWDGKFHHQLQPAGNYVYYVEGDCNGKSFAIKGWVVLIR